MNSGSAAVDKVGQMNIQGNIIPPFWYRNIRFKTGRPHFIAITLLSEVLYWYRPTVVRDESSGNVVELKKKFKADRLQRSYQSLADQFGFTKRQVKEALDFLDEHDLMIREFRDIKSESGVPLNNVMFLEPVVENIEKLTYEEFDLTLLRSDVPPPTLECTPSSVEAEDPPTPQRGTYTEITTEITTDIKKEEDEENASAPNPFQFFEQNGFGTIGSYIAEKISLWCDDLSPELVLEAMKLATEYGVKTWKYTESILRSWADKGVKTAQDAQALQQAMKEQKSRQRRNTSRFPASKKQESKPDWFDEEKERRKKANEEAIRKQQEDFDFEEQRRKLEEELKNRRRKP
ncbi:hypothetical protein GCM10008967_00130 [Bacillus carboniphilus]|uniref:DnaB/C C-terminal domain-containing protein n=1 Tax=Bacillus carboniphilus TaxID=86663 RepID=A0ABN0VP26_9BACI